MKIPLAEKDVFIKNIHVKKEGFIIFVIVQVYYDKTLDRQGN